MPEGTLRLALTQAKVSHANILSIDTTEAESMPGVVRVITAKDIKAAGGTNKINGLVMLPKQMDLSVLYSVTKRYSSLVMRSQS